jgi:hypothetical protein
LVVGEAVTMLVVQHDPPLTRPLLRLTRPDEEANAYGWAWVCIAPSSQHYADTAKEAYYRWYRWHWDYWFNVKGVSPP